MDISVIVPFYKGNQYMPQLFSCIRENALHAPQLAIELVLVNDSPDCPIDYQADWAQGFTLQIVTNEVNSGIQKARVNGLAASCGEFVIFLDQDDRLESDALLFQFEAIGSSDIVLANGYNENKSGNEPIYRTLAQQRIAATDQFYYTVSNQITSPGQCMIRRSVMPPIWCQGCISRNGSDDLLLWLMLFQQKAAWAVNPRCLYTHVDTGCNLSNDIDKMIASSYEALSVLQQYHLISQKQQRQFIRGRKMASLYIGKPLWKKMLAVLLYPDIAWQRFLLRRYSQQ